MALKTILFDLDGTLLPMDQTLFTKAYFKLLAGKMAPYGYEPERLIDSVWKGTAAMVRNDGSCTNEERFWQVFSELYAGERDARLDEPKFAEFYHTDFQQAKSLCGYQPEAAAAVHRFKEMGCDVALATNPLFPAIATESRIRWAGLEPSDFLWYTTYENSTHCKPNPAYYRDLLARLDCQPEECLMVGNDAKEDLIAETVGMQVFLLTDCLINTENKDYSAYPHGGFKELVAFVEQQK